MRKPLLCYELQGGRNGSAGGGEYARHFRLRKGKKALHDDRIELSAAGHNQAANRLFKWQASAVRPRGDHGVERVDDRNNSRNDGDFRLFQTSGIPLTVESFMVMQNVERGALKPREHAQHRPAILRMLLHQRVFVGFQFSGLSEDGVGNANFSDIVKQRGNLQVLQHRLFESEFLADAHAPFRQARAVYAGVEVLEVQELVERTDD